MNLKIIFFVLIILFSNMGYAKKATFSISPVFEYANIKGHFGYGAFLEFTSTESNLVMRAEKIFGDNNSFGISFGQKLDLGKKIIKIESLTPRFGLKYFKNIEEKLFLTLAIDCRWKYITISPSILVNNHEIRASIQLTL